ncbi:MAG TPA: methylmalonyl Co-A mutase-associated GTPase MeaB [Thermoanaerobaculia bacterium]|nr:methylmalonyl Co-A mutase-associated GTPase MeaB [Thermoanaerobaculia bacterium]
MAGFQSERRGRGARFHGDLAGFLDELVPQVLERNHRALGRAISLLEDGGDGQRELVRRVYERTGHARVVGITGPPGAGKSTLVDRLARLCRGRGETVGILAVDPTSPYTGGALLGDRIRMQTLYTDPGVFIRSMATRGAMGGLARASRDAVDVLDAAGFDWILVETVGVGQDEVDVVRTVDTVAVVTVPGLGDDIQAIKAGILEIADVFVINKADREGVDRTAKDLEMMLSLGEHGEWVPPIVRTVASREEGVDRVLGEMERHRDHLLEGGGLERRRLSHLRLRVETILKERVVSTADRILGVEREVERGYGQRLDPYRVADRLFTGVLRSAQDVGSAGEVDPGPAGPTEERMA